MSKWMLRILNEVYYDGGRNAISKKKEGGVGICLLFRFNSFVLVKLLVTIKHGNYIQFSLGLIRL